MFHVYVIRNPKGLLYKGQTIDLHKRIEQHNADDSFSSYTKNRGPWELVYSEECKTRAEAKMREKYLKSGIGRIFLKEYLSKHSD